MDRAVRVALIEQELEVGERDENGWRPVTHGGVEVGLLIATGAESWQFVWRDRDAEAWRSEENRSLVGATEEAAEGWIVREVATYFAMKEEVEERDG